MPLSKSRPVTAKGISSHAGLQRGQDVDVRVVAHRAGEHPPGVHVGQVQGAGELALQGRAAVRDGVALEEPGLGLDLVAGLADLDRGPQQRRRFRGRDTPDLVGGLGRRAGTGRSTPRTSPAARPAPPCCTGPAPSTSSPCRSSAVQLGAHRRGEVLAALPTRGGPHPLQHLPRVVGVLRRPRLPRPRGDRAGRGPAGCCAAATSRRRALSRDQPVTDTTSSSTRPLSFFAAFTYALAYLVVTSARDVIDNPLLMPHDAHRYAGIPT